MTTTPANRCLVGAGALALLLTVLFPPMISARDNRPYMYLDQNGTHWFTDRPIRKEAFVYLGRYGRPTAERSCRGVNDRLLRERAAPHLALIRAHSAAERVDPALVKAVITVESCFDTHAVSRVGAKGLMQLMPATASELGVHNVFNPEENIRAGVQYLRQMLERFGHNTRLALAAYNAGPSAVERYRGIPPYRETRNYVRKVLAVLNDYR